MDKARVDIAELRSFGYIFAGIVAVLFGLLLPWLFGEGWPHWPWYTAGGVGALALLAPALLRPLYRGWMAFGGIMGWINTRLILGLLFFLILLPIGLLMRLVASDPMRRRLEPTAPSYRISREAQAREQMEKPY